MANELHEQLTGRPAEGAPWPEPEPEFESALTEVRERLIEDVTEDVHDIIDVTGTDPETVRLYVAPGWKREVFETVRSVGTDVGTVMSEVMQDEQLREKGNAVNDLVGELVEFVRERSDDQLDALDDVDELAVYEDAVAFFEREFDADVQVFDAGGDVEDPAGKAEEAVPFRPAIHIE